MRNLSIILFILLSTVVNAQDWEVLQITDEFGDKTGEPYTVTYDLDGIFSNTATTNSSLSSVVYCDVNGDIQIKLLEYGEYKTNFSRDFTTIKIKDISGKRHTIKCIKSKSFIYFGEEGAVKLRLLLESNEYLKCYFKDDSSTYTFKIYTVNFTESLTIIGSYEN